MKKTLLILGLALLSTVGVDAMAGGDDPVVSRTRGKPGGWVVLWPRIVPESNDAQLIDLAKKLQQRLSTMATRTISDKKFSVRPHPERVCPQAGCKAVSISVMLGHQDGGCVAVAMLGDPGNEEYTSLIPWAGTVELRSTSIAFRQPPEDKLSVKEFVPCDELLNFLDNTAVENAIASMAPDP